MSLQTSRKIGAAVVLIVIIAVALLLIWKKAGLGGGADSHYEGTIIDPAGIELIDRNSFVVISKTLREWDELGVKEGAFKNPTTGQYTMVGAMTCAFCGATIPTPQPPAVMRPPGAPPDDSDSWPVTFRCPKCGQKTDHVIEGRVLDVHMLGKADETVTVCHFDPKYVVVVQIESGVEKLAIHSPARTFMGADPVGKSYKFHLSTLGKHFLLENVEEIRPQPAHAEGDRGQ